MGLKTSFFCGEVRLVNAMLNACQNLTHNYLLQKVGNSVCPCYTPAQNEGYFVFTCTKKSIHVMHRENISLSFYILASCSVLSSRESEKEPEREKKTPSPPYGSNYIIMSRRVLKEVRSSGDIKH